MKGLIDESLLQPRPVVSVTDSDDGLGFDVELACGHRIWQAMRPGDEACCSVCLWELGIQVSETQNELRQMPL